MQGTEVLPEPDPEGPGRSAAILDPPSSHK